MKEVINTILKKVNNIIDTIDSEGIEEAVYNELVKLDIISKEEKFEEYDYSFVSMLTLGQYDHIIFKEEMFGIIAHDDYNEIEFFPYEILDYFDKQLVDWIVVQETKIIRKKEEEEKIGRIKWIKKYEEEIKKLNEQLKQIKD